MKKKVSFTLFLMLVLLAFGCNSKNKTQTCEENPNQDKCQKEESCEENPNQNKCIEDKISPIISFSYSTTSLTIKMSELSNLNLMEGVTAIDNLDGYITDSVICDDEDVDYSKEGTYTLYYYVADSHGNVSDIKSRSLTIIRDIVIPRPAVYNEIISDEKSVPNKGVCFDGDWSYTALSSDDHWAGMDTTLTLPMVYLSRYTSSIFDSTVPTDPNTASYDNPSIYLGGSGKFSSTYAHEIDAGLSFSTPLDHGKRITGAMVFKIFWRYESSNKDLTSIPYQDNNYEWGQSLLIDNESYKNVWADTGSYYSYHYYLPGDKLRMVCYATRNGWMRLEVQVLEVSKLQYSIDLRKKYEWDNPIDFISPEFPVTGFGISNSIVSHYKRVNAIDQVNNEGGKTIETDTRVENCIWEDCYLYRYIDGTLYSVPMNSERSLVYGCPKENAFKVGEINSVGGQIVTIDPKGIINN